MKTARRESSRSAVRLPMIANHQLSETIPKEFDIAFVI